MRHLLALFAGAFTAAFGALLLGEYDLTTGTGPAAGLVLGVAVGEVVRAVVRRDPLPLWEPLGAVTAVIAAQATWWAVWISTNRGRNPMGVYGAIAIVIAAVMAGGWVSSARRRRASTPRRP